MTSRLSTVQLDKVSASPPALKLPPLFSLTPNSAGKGGNMQKRQTQAQANQADSVADKRSLDLSLSNNHIDSASQGLHFLAFL